MVREVYPGDMVRRFTQRAGGRVGLTIPKAIFNPVYICWHDISGHDNIIKPRHFTFKDDWLLNSILVPYVYPVGYALHLYNANSSEPSLSSNVCSFLNYYYDLNYPVCRQD